MTDSDGAPEGERTGPASDGEPVTVPDLDPLHAVDAALEKVLDGLRDVGWDAPAGTTDVGLTASAVPTGSAALPRASAAVDRAVGRVARWSIAVQEWGEARISRVRQR